MQDNVNPTAPASITNHAFNQGRFNPEEAMEFGRTQVTAGIAVQLQAYIAALDKLPEEQRPAFGTPERATQSFARLALQGYTLKRIDINRENAKLSTGPRTASDIVRSSLNAQKHGLTGQSVLVGDEDRAQYDAHTERMHALYRPIGEAELDIVSELSDTRWRLNRIPRLEAGIYAKGRMQFRDAFFDVDTDLQADLIEAEVHLFYAKDLKNLHLQESRLNRKRDKLEAKLEKLQAERRRTEEESRQQAEREARISAARVANRSKAMESAPKSGFVFTDESQQPPTEPCNVETRTAFNPDTPQRQR
jgi:hypothetical protein